MEPLQQEAESYASGFNNASILAEFAPELLADINPGNNPDNCYFDGFFAGKEYYTKEQTQNKELNELDNLRNSNQERGNDLELDF